MRNRDYAVLALIAGIAGLWFWNERMNRKFRDIPDAEPVPELPPGRNGPEILSSAAAHGVGLFGPANLGDTASPSFRLSDQGLVDSYIATRAGAVYAPLRDVAAANAAAEESANATARRFWR